jgi:hypothetical protein
MLSFFEAEIEYETERSLLGDDVANSKEMANETGQHEATRADILLVTVLGVA